MGLNRAIEGSRYTGQQLTWTQQDGTAQDLTGATMSGVIVAEDGTERAITGALTLVTPASGIFNWAYSAVDVGTVGRFMVQFKADYGSGYDLTFQEEWIVEPAL